MTRAGSGCRRDHVVGTSEVGVEVEGGRADGLADTDARSQMEDRFGPNAAHGIGEFSSFADVDAEHGAGGVVPRRGVQAGYLSACFLEPPDEVSADEAGCSGYKDSSAALHEDRLLAYADPSCNPIAGGVRLAVRRLRPFFTALVLLGACDSGETAPAAASQAATRAGFEVAVGGSAWASAKPKDEGYSLKSPDGADLGKISVGADRVKLKDPSGTTKAKVKRKDYGFKVYQDDETAVLKVKRKGAGYKLKRDDGTELGELATKQAGGTVSGEAITVTSEGGRRIVERAGAQVGTVGAAIPEKAAGFLGVTELTVEQRVAAMVYVQEHES